MLRIKRQLFLLKPEHVCVLLFGVGSLLILLLSERIGQPVGYHELADQRLLFTLSGTGDLISNIPFVVFGILGLVLIYFGKISFQTDYDKYLIHALLAVSILAGINSFVYHIKPNNTLIIFDRFTILFGISIFSSYVISFNRGVSSSLKCLIIFIIYGLMSLLYWSFTDLSGVDDIRFYGFFQTATVAMSVIVALRSFRENFWIVVGTGLFVVSRPLELMDHEVFHWTGENLSGHSMKHILISLVIPCVLAHLMLRRST